MDANNLTARNSKTLETEVYTFLLSHKVIIHRKGTARITTDFLKTNNGNRKMAQHAIMKIRILDLNVLINKTFRTASSHKIDFLLHFTQEVTGSTMIRQQTKNQAIEDLT